MTEAPPIACTLAPGALKDRLAWIGALARDALRSHKRRDLVLDLRYAPEARERVHEMVRGEQACCSFLTFDLREAPDAIHLTITAPETAREAADMLFEQFVAGGPPSRPAPVPCIGCDPGFAKTTRREDRRTDCGDAGDRSGRVRRMLRAAVCLIGAAVILIGPRS